MTSIMIGLLIILVLLFLALFFLSNPKKYILFFIAATPIINIFWFYKIGMFSVIDLIVGCFPSFFILIFFYISSKGVWRWGKYSNLFFLYALSFLFPILSLHANDVQLFDLLSAFLKIMCAFTSYHIFLNLFRYQEKDKIIKVVKFAIFVTILMVSGQLLTDYGVNIGQKSYLLGIYSDQGVYNRIALLGVIVFLPGMSMALKREGMINIMMFFMCALVLGYAISRNASLSAIGVVISYALITRRMAVVLLALIISVSLYLLSPTIQDLYTVKLQTEMIYMQGGNIDIATLGSGRLGIWERVINEFNYATNIEKLFGRGKGIGPHGQLFDLLRRNGIMGVFIAILFWGKLFLDTLKGFWRDRNDIVATYSFLGVVAVLILFFGSSPMYNYFLQIILFGFIALLERKQYDMPEQMAADIEDVKNNDLYGLSTSA